MTYLIRLKPYAEAPASRDYTVGKVHLLDPERGRAGGPNMTRFAWMGAPARCGKELDVVAQLGNPFDGGSDRRAVLHFADVVRARPGREPVLRMLRSGADRQVEPMRRYAEGTPVPVEVSQAEIRTILARHGCKHFATAEEPDRSAIQFVLGGLPYRFTIERPTIDSERTAYKERWRSGMRHDVDYRAKAEAEWRRRWRARLLWLKATLEFAAGEGPEEVAAALMAHLVLPDGNTMQRWAARELPAAFRDGAMPPLLLGGGT